MTTLKYKIGDFITYDYETALKYAKETGKEIVKLYIFERDGKLEISKNDEEEVKNVSR